MRHYVLDLEVFKCGWLASFKDTKTGEFYDFINDPDLLREFIKAGKLVVCGFNNKHYDNYVLKAMCHGFSTADIKDLNDWIIGGGQGWEWPKWSRQNQPFEAYDIRDDLPMALSLKEIEGNMGLPIVESSIPFDYDKPQDYEQWQEIVKYCHFDIDAADEIRKKRKDYLDSKVYVGKLAGLSKAKSLAMTNAKLTAALLAGKNAKPKEWGDDTDYQIPNNLKVKNKEILEFYKVIDPEYKERLVVDIAGVEHTLAYGGLHGARPNYIGKSTTDRQIINIDVVSYYPSLMIVNGYLSRAVPDPTEFERIYVERVEAKKSKDTAKADALKLVLNTTYGAMKNQYNPLYDPLMANGVCISGQLYLIDLIEKLQQVPTLELVQSNTDGIMVAVDDQYRKKVEAVIQEWEKRTGFQMEFDQVKVIYQKDVNNYVMVTVKDGKEKVKVKGAYVSNYKGGSIVNASIPIVAKAIVEYLLNGVQPEYTIRQANNIMDFQFIAKTGRTYQKTIWRNGDSDDIHEVQRVNRVYASLDADHGTIYKVKSDGRKDKIANLPDRCLIDNDNELVELSQKIPIDELIDLNFYIDMAKKRIQDFIGTLEPFDKIRIGNYEIKRYETGQISFSKVEPEVEVMYFYHPESDSYWSGEKDEIGVDNIDASISIPISKEQYDEGMRTGKSIYELNKKKEEVEMTTKTTADKTTATKTVEKAKVTLTLSQKIFELRKTLASFVWEKDGKNMQQQYKYITEAQYKKYFEQALEEVGLDYRLNIEELVFNQNITDKMHLSTIKVTIDILDPDSGEIREYQTYGTGADMGDKGLYKAMTGALKYFIATNFLIAENNDPENDEPEVKPKSNRPASPDKRKADKEEIMKTEEPATAAQKAKVKEMRDIIKGSGKYAEVVTKINKTMKGGPSKVECNKLIMEIEEIVEEILPM